MVVSCASSYHSHASVAEYNLVFSFAPDDIQDIAPNLIKVLLAKIEASGSPEKVAENDHLMKCIATEFQRTTIIYSPSCWRRLYGNKKDASLVS